MTTIRAKKMTKDLIFIQIHLIPSKKGECIYRI
jgi:hypothetical protein